MRNCGTEKLSNLPKLTQLTGAEPRLGAQSIRYSGICVAHVNEAWFMSIRSLRERMRLCPSLISTQTFFSGNMPKILLIYPQVIIGIMFSLTDRYCTGLKSTRSHQCTTHSWRDQLGYQRMKSFLFLLPFPHIRVLIPKTLIYPMLA